jgi:hypothetical protein
MSHQSPDAPYEDSGNTCRNVDDDNEDGPCFRAPSGGDVVYGCAPTVNAIVTGSTT